MSENTQAPRTPNPNAVYRLALFAALLVAWCSPAAAQSVTGWPLAGVHLTTKCTDCHKNNVYKGTARDCYTCHKTSFTSSVNPPHVASGFPTTCDTCHKFSDAAWKPASFNHNTNTTFPLAGLHTTQACATCHKNNIYKGTPRDCYTCHTTDYQKSVNPPHLAAGFLTTCDSCHRFSDSAWKPSTFNHSTNTTFPLVGLHASQACAKCHTVTLYKNTPITCVGCHLTAYNTASPVNHISAGFPTTCESCHKATDSVWTLGVFNHSYFPITSGNHKVACNQCHKTANVYTVFTCTDCHGQSSMASKHKGRNGYVWTSVACYACHPNGRS